MEMASTYAAILIANLLNVHALASMHRASGNDEYRKSAAEWLPALESQMESLRATLSPKEPRHEG